MTHIEFKLEKEPNPRTGTLVDSIVKYTETPDKIKPGEMNVERDVWCSVDDLDTLFSTCVERWGSNWDLNKVMTAIREGEID